MKKEVLIGNFDMGWQSVTLILRDGSGGEFCCIPDDGVCARIVVGAGKNESDWHACFCSLMHEAWEMAMFQADLRYSPSNRTGIASHADYLFVMTHEQFHACCAKVSEFMRPALPALEDGFKKWHKTNKRKTKK